MILRLLYDELKKHSDNLQLFINNHKEQTLAYEAVLNNPQMWILSRVYLADHMRAYNQAIQNIDLHLGQFLKDESQASLRKSYQVLKNIATTLKAIPDHLHDQVSKLDTAAFITEVDHIIEKCELFFNEVEKTAAKIQAVVAEEAKKKVPVSSSATFSTIPRSTLQQWPNWTQELITNSLNEIERDLLTHLGLAKNQTQKKRAF
ncbi:MAG: hypothetical protein WC748_10315 [Legionellales bacterium]|jgi:hypothetical protein